jgi:F0F1-type ATP synthase assembly protein I
MPESKSRHAHKHPQDHHKTSNTHPKSKKSNRAVIVAVIFFAFLGLGIGFFIDASSIPVLLAGAIVGGFAGFLFGNQVSKSLSEK